MNTQKDTLYIIGNGFDLHHGLNTSYKKFRDNVVLKAPNLWKQLIDIYGDDVTKNMWWSDKVLGDMNKEALKNWNDNYGNLNKMYRTHYKKSDWAGPYDYENGWNLCILEHDYEGVYQTWIFPYAVGYIKQDYYLGDNYLPIVDSAVNDAFEFFTSNEKSTYYSTFEKGSVDRVWSAIYDAQNEYYYMAEDERPRFNRIGR